MRGKKVPKWEQDEIRSEGATNTIGHIAKTHGLSRGSVKKYIRSGEEK